MNALAGLEKVFREVFGNPQLHLQRGMNSSNVEGWDSFSQVNLIIAMEEEFKTSFTAEEIGKMSSIDAILSTLETKGIR